MEDYIFRKSIFFIFLIGFLIFMLYFFSPNRILNLISTKEHLVNLFKPNKVFYHNNQIYLMDTQHLMGDENPKIFKNYEEFQKYILDLEDKHLIKLPLDKKKIIEGVDTIKQFKYERDLSLNKKELIDFENSRICNNKESLCSFDNNMALKRNYDEKTENRDKYIYSETDLSRDPYNMPIPSDIVAGYKDEEILKKSKMIDTDKLKKYQYENCTEKLLDDTTCNEIKNMIDNTNNLNERCYVKNEDSEICKKYNKNRWNLELLNNYCVKTNENYDFNKCLEGEYFKENLLDFEL